MSHFNSIPIKVTGVPISVPNNKFVLALENKYHNIMWQLSRPLLKSWPIYEE